jgi:hypothetical protein
MEETMQTPAFPALQARYRSFTHRGSHETAASRYLQTHAVGGIVRGLFMSSLLWMLIAFTVYTVYTMVLGTR